MKLAAICVTFRRPHLLGQMIESFNRQTYPLEKRQLIILADDGCYENQSGPGWYLISVPKRFADLGQKRNAATALADYDTDAFLVWDDDDITLPHAFATHAEALKYGDFCRPSLVLVEDGPGRLREARTDGLYHSGWSYTRELFHRVNGYRSIISNGEDQDLAARMNAVGAKHVDPSKIAPPYYFYRDTSGSYHLSWMGAGHDGYRAAEREPARGEFRIGWPTDYTTWPIRRLHPPIAPHVAPKAGVYNVELIGPQPNGGNDGPSQGMHALQKAINARKLDWLRIKANPPTPGNLAWFWNWQDKETFVRWDQAGHPSLIGPNVIFEYSGNPGGAPHERDILNARNVRGYFCHSGWYADLIQRHKTCKAPIFQWPYPIDEWPGEPEPDQFDLLIYAKNGHRPALLEHLASVFPRHVQIHYGRYQRGELFAAARRSRACAYLADDDHGPLALQEILLAGCPAIGVRTGVSLITNGVTGKWVPRLPPGEPCLETDQNREDLAFYLAELRTLMEFDRRAVRAVAAQQFDTNRIVDTLIDHLEQTRRVEHNSPEMDERRRV